MTFFASRLLPLALLALAAACSDPDKSHADDPGGGSGGTMSATAGRGGSSGTAGSGGSSATSGSSGAGGSSGTAGEVPACNDVVLDAPDYVMSMEPGMQPAAKGGTIVDGAYFLKRTLWYGQTGSDLPMGRAKFEIAGGSWELAEDMDSSDEDDSLEPTRHFSLTATASGTSLTLVQTCPTSESASTQTAEYTAEGTGLTLYLIDQGEHFAQVLERE
jgi:hypothetical protein